MSSVIHYSSAFVIFRCVIFIIECIRVIQAFASLSCCIAKSNDITYCVSFHVLIKFDKKQQNSSCYVIVVTWQCLLMEEMARGLYQYQ